MSSPTKIRKGVEGPEEDFTSFVENALSPLASGNYTQSAENSRDAFSISNSQSHLYQSNHLQQHQKQNSYQQDQNQQHLRLNVPSSNEWSPNISQSSFDGCNNEFKMCFNDASSSDGGFPSRTSTHSRMRLKKLEGSADSESLLQQQSLYPGHYIQNSIDTLHYNVDEGACNSQNSNGSVAIGVMQAQVAEAGRHQLGGTEPFRVNIPGYTKSSLDLDDEDLEGMTKGQSPLRNGVSGSEIRLPTRMSNAMISKSSSISSVRGHDVISAIPVTTDKYGAESSGVTRARRKTSKASELKLTKGKQVEINAVGFGSLLRAPLGEQRVTCNCKKSKCLKLYCECFHALKYCSGCNCYDCENRVGNDEIREAVIAAIKERNPDAFDSKMKSDASGVKRHSNGCHCKRSACLKKYCECFSLAIPCGDKCRCLKCPEYTFFISTEGWKCFFYCSHVC